jgi:hypothetical protein
MQNKMKKKGRFVIQEINEEIPEEIKPILNEINYLKKSYIHHSSFKLKNFKQNIVSNFIESFDNNNKNKVLIFDHKKKTWINFNKIFSKNIKTDPINFEKIFSYFHTFNEENTENKNIIDNLGYSSSNLSINSFDSKKQNHNQTNLDIFKRENNYKSLTLKNLENNKKYIEIINQLKNGCFFSQKKKKIKFQNDFDDNSENNSFEKKYFYVDEVDNNQKVKSQSTNKLPKFQKKNFSVLSDKINKNLIKSSFNKKKLKKIEIDNFEVINNKIHKFSILKIQKQFCITIK